ncbi:MAG: hypothetical protein KDJ69_09935 [Nitratireductor sp.]|nr:hypothetical protein [Nitratireductor sp.]
MFAHRFNTALAGILTAASVLAVAPAAEARIDARKLTCQQARSLVQQQGAIVMSFTNTAYDRVVRNRQFCNHGMITKPLFVQTLDHPKCHVGGICIEDPWKDSMRLLFRRN